MDYRNNVVWHDKVSKSFANANLITPNKPSSWDQNSTRKSLKIDSIDVHGIDHTTSNVVVWFLDSMYVVVGQSKRGIVSGKRGRLPTTNQRLHSFISSDARFAYLKSWVLNFYHYKTFVVHNNFCSIWMLQGSLVQGKLGTHFPWIA